MLKIFCILIIAYSAATKWTHGTRWVDFQENTCINVNTMSQYLKPAMVGTDGALHSSTGIKKFLGLDKDDCKKKCVEYNMEQYVQSEEYPCRAIEWSDRYTVKKQSYQNSGRGSWSWVYEPSITTVCHLSFKMEHQTYDGIFSSACKDWHVSIMWSQDIKGSSWTSNCTLKMVNYGGHDLYESCDKVDSYQECRKKCQDDGRCGFWTYVVDDPWHTDNHLTGGCCLKDHDAALSIHDIKPSSCTGVCLYSGPKDCINQN